MSADSTALRNNYWELLSDSLGRLDKLAFMQRHMFESSAYIGLIRRDYWTTAEYQTYGVIPRIMTHRTDSAVK